MVLGDNIFENEFDTAIRNFKKGAMIFLKEVEHPERFGVATFDETGKRILAIEEKPKKPKSKYVQTGFYLFDNGIFPMIQQLKPSARGELEITDAINEYLRRGELAFSFVDGFWSDAGTFETLLASSNWIAGRNKP